MNNNKLKKGQSLWEVILALAIASLVALGLVRSTTSSVKSTRYSASESEATALAQKKIAEIKSYIDDNYSDFWSLFEDPPETILIPGLTSDDVTTDPNYCINVQVFSATDSLPTIAPNDDSGLMARVVVYVFWDQKAGEGDECNEKDYESSVHLETYVTNR